MVFVDPEISDDQALLLAAQGDQQAFGVLYERYVGRIYNYIYYRTGNTAEAEDLTARVFFRAMQNIHKYRNRGLPLSAWLYRIAHNLVANWYRDHSRRSELSLEEGLNIPHHSDLPEQQLLHGEEFERLLAVIRKLPSERQQLIVLKFVDDLSNLEIGKIMGRSEGAVKSLYHRTLLALRESMGEFPMAKLTEQVRNTENWDGEGMEEIL